MAHSSGLTESCLDVLLAELCGRDVSQGEKSLSRLAAIEMHGYEVGYRFLERSLQTRSIQLGGDLEVMKFICKDFWQDLFGKHVDKLQTNHRGIFVLRETAFRWARRLSSHDDDLQRAHAAHLLQFPCGLLRGALAQLGIEATVTAEVINLPACNFNVRITKSPASGGGTTNSTSSSAN